MEASTKVTTKECGPVMLQGTVSQLQKEIKNSERECTVAKNNAKKTSNDLSKAQKELQSFQAASSTAKKEVEATKQGVIAMRHKREEAFEYLEYLLRRTCITQSSVLSCKDDEEATGHVKAEVSDLIRNKEEDYKNMEGCTPLEIQVVEQKARVMELKEKRDWLIMRKRASSMEVGSKLQWLKVHRENITKELEVRRAFKAKLVKELDDRKREHARLRKKFADQNSHLTLQRDRAQARVSWLTVELDKAEKQLERMRV